ncbi:MAG: macro domain-containing protein, partial [Longimicrobiales bacterium]
MLTYVSGDLFRSPAQTLVNTVNTVGVMGKGVALTFKHSYPEMFKRYRALCEAGEYDIGKLFLWRTPHKWVLNLPTKKHWRNPSRPEYVEAGLNAFVRNFEKMRISSVAFPPLGCG